MDHPAPPTDDLRFGQYAHSLLLQPERTEQDFMIMPALNLRTKADRETRDALMAECDRNGITPVTVDDAVLAHQMVDKCHSDQTVMTLLDGAHEKEFFWVDELTGEMCKCRVDCLTQIDGKFAIVDYKTTKDAYTHKFILSGYNFGYHFQSGFYCTGVKKCLGLDYLPRFILIAQEKKAPFSLNVIELPEDVIQRGVDLYREYLGTYHECKETGIWYGYNGPFGEMNEAYLLEWVKDGQDD